MNTKIKGKKIISILANLFLALSLFFPFSSRAIWVDFDAAGAANRAIDQALNRQEDIFSSMESRYGFSEDSLRAAKRKINAPRVEISFDNTNPKPGEKVTASAIPEFFKNDPQNLYYTWYLIHTKDGTPQTATNSIRKGKIEASRIMAAGDYDPDLDGQNYSDTGRDPDKDGWPATDNDNEKSYAPMGGADGVGGLDKAHTEQACSTRGNRDVNECGFVTSDPTSLSYYTLNASQANYWCGLCYDYFSENGNFPSATSTESRNSCCYTVDPPTYTDPDTGDIITYPYNSSTDYCSGKSYADPFKTCFDNFGTNNSATASQCITDRYSECLATHTSVNDEIYDGVSRCYRHKFSSGTDTAFRTDDSSGLDFPVDCSHKWEDATGYVSGSGHFPTGEEKYWKTDPADPDTDGDGFSDEADVIGLRQESFTWTYQAGDRVGVVAEGTSIIPTDEKNAYYKIMWGYPDICDTTKKDLLQDDECGSSDDYGYGFLATKAPNEAEAGEKLKVSLSFSPDNPTADPSSENKDNILNDGTITDADQITVTSSLDNTNFNPGTLYYTWQISKSADLASDNWEEVKNIEDNFSLATATNGLGLTSLNFAPKKKVLTADAANVIYFKVTLTVSTASGVKANRGRASVVVPINKNGIKIGLYKVDVTDGKAALGEEVCQDGLYKVMCPAVKNQMLAAKVTSKKYDLGSSDFSWSLDGKPYNIPAGSAQYFDGLDERAIIFPIAKEEQETEEITVTATPKSELSPVTGGRLVTVVHPAVFIKPDDLSVSWPQVITVENTEKKDQYQNIASPNSFEAVAGNEVAYRIDFVPYYLLNNDPNIKIDWALNGASIHDIAFYDTNPLLGSAKLEDNDYVFRFPTDAREGAYYNLSASVRKYWSDEEKNIMSSVWGMDPQALTGEASATISTVLQKPTEEISQNQPTQMLAAIGTHLPHYLMYNLRLALTLLVMFFVSAGFYALSQRISLGVKGEKNT